MKPLKRWLFCFNLISITFTATLVWHNENMDTELDQVLTNSLHLHYNQNIMNNAVIQIRTDQELKESAQKVAEELGFSLSSLIKAFLKNVTRTKTVTFSTGEAPSAWLIEQMAQAQKDLQVGDYHKFNSATESLEFLKKQGK